MLAKHIDFESKEEGQINFGRSHKKRGIVMVGHVPQEQTEAELTSDTDQIAKQILESLEKNGGE